MINLEDGFPFLFNSFGDVNESLNFSYTGTNLNNPNNCDQLEYIWDFGDGESAIGKNVSHTYSSVGNYNVRLKINCKCCGPISVETKKSLITPVSIL